jgi:hypothetical protein
MLCAYKSIKFSRLSIELCLSENRINDIVAGKPIKIRPDEIDRIANFFQVPVDALIHKRAYLDYK